MTFTSFDGIPWYLNILFHRESRWMLSNAFSKTIKLAYRGAFNSLLYSRICLRVEMWSEHERPGGIKTYLFLLDSRVVFTVLLRFLADTCTPFLRSPSTNVASVENILIVTTWQLVGIHKHVNSGSTLVILKPLHITETSYFHFRKRSCSFPSLLQSRIDPFVSTSIAIKLRSRR